MKFWTILFFSFFISCLQTESSFQSIEENAQPETVYYEQGTELESRFRVPRNYNRVPVESGSFANYLRHLPLKPEGTLVKYFDGETKSPNAYVAVVDMEISPKDLQQCADAVIRLRGEYFYSTGQFDKISFTLTNGFVTDYLRWMEGERVAVSGNKTWWVKKKEPSNTYKDFREYIDFVFNYAGTLSLSKELIKKDVKDLAIGDVFIVGGSPGHAVIVVDLAVNQSGEKIFMLAQSYMPAQETQILKNPDDSEMSPWYSLNFGEELITPEWIFQKDQLQTWR